MYRGDMMRKKYLGIRLMLLVLLSLILLPLILTFIYSFCSMEEMNAFLATRGQYQGELMEIKLVPKMFSLAQYWDVMIADTTNLRFYLNSIMYTAAILLGQLAVVPATAYGLSRFRFFGRDALAFLVIMLLLLPFQVTMVPTVLTMRAMGLIDSPWAMILPSIASPLYIFLLRQSMLFIPNELFEAGQIDGAGPIRSYIYVALPVSKAMIGAFVALSFADCWNMVEQPLVFLPSVIQLHPLSVVFNQLGNSGSSFAGAALYLLPALMVYLFFQEDIVNGIQLSELK